MSFLRSSSDSVARSGKGSIVPFRSRVKLNFSLCVRPESRASRARGGGLALLDLVDEAAELARQLLRLLARLSLRVEMDERLVGIGQHLRPPAVLEQLDPVGQVEVASRETL